MIVHSVREVRAALLEWVVPKMTTRGGLDMAACVIRALSCPLRPRGSTASESLVQLSNFAHHPEGPNKDLERAVCEK
jgi:hypothetical protein